MAICSFTIPSGEACTMRAGHESAHAVAMSPSYTLTVKGWAAATAPERACGHGCLICDHATVSDLYRRWALLAFRVAKVTEDVAFAPPGLARHRLTVYRDRLIVERDAAFEELKAGA